MSVIYDREQARKQQAAEKAQRKAMNAPKPRKVYKNRRDDSTAREWLEHIRLYGVDQVERVPEPLLPLVRLMAREAGKSA